MNSFRARDRFDRVVFTLVAHQITEDKVAGLKKAFFSLDANHDGVVSKGELRAGLLMSPDLAPMLKSQESFDEFFDYLDANHDEKVNYSEWLSGTLAPSSVASKEAVHDLFKYFDREGTGRIQRADLAEIIGDYDADKVLRAGDTDHDDKLSEEEFKGLMKNIALKGGGSPKTPSTPFQKHLAVCDCDCSPVSGIRSRAVNRGGC